MLYVEHKGYKMKLQNVTVFAVCFAIAYVTPLLTEIDDYHQRKLI